MYVWRDELGRWFFDDWLMGDDGMMGGVWSFALGFCLGYVCHASCVIEMK